MCICVCVYTLEKELSVSCMVGMCSNIELFPQSNPHLYLKTDLFCIITCYSQFLRHATTFKGAVYRS